MRVVENPESGRKITMAPGVLRSEHVRVGRHVAPDPVDLPAFIKRFAEGYTSPNLSLLRELDVGSELWSVSRGLARSVDNYKTMLQAADEPRRGDLDGRGNLTLAGLTEFCRYFLSTCIDQIDFMEGLLEPSELLRRMEIWAKEETAAKRLRKGSWPILRMAVLDGEFARGDAADFTGYATRQARTVLNDLINQGYLISETTRSPVRLGFPASVVDRWFPRLYGGGQ